MLNVPLGSRSLFLVCVSIVMAPDAGTSTVFVPSVAVANATFFSLGGDNSVDAKPLVLVGNFLAGKTISFSLPPSS